MATTGPLVPTSAQILAGGTGTWNSTVSATLVGYTNADDSSYAIWTKPSGTGQTSPGLEVWGFDTSVVPAGSDINSVTVSIICFNSNTSRLAAPTWELWDGTSARIGAIQTGTNATSSSTNNSFTFTGITYSQLATLRVRVYGKGGSTSTSGTFSVDYIRFEVDYAATYSAAGTSSATAGSAGEVGQIWVGTSGTVTCTSTVAGDATIASNNQQAGGTVAVSSTVFGETSLIAGAAGLPAYVAYNFDESGTANATDYGSAGIAMTTIQGRTTGHTGNAITVTSSYGAGLAKPIAHSGSWALMGWFRVRSTGGWSSLVQCGASYDFVMEVNGLAFDAFMASLNFSFGTFTMTSNTWTHLAVVQNGTTNQIRVVKDGTTVGSPATSTGTQLPAGTYNVAGSGDQPGSMEVDDFRIVVGTALTDSDIQTYMNTPVSAGGAGASTFAARGTSAATSSVSGSATALVTGTNPASGTIALASTVYGAPTAYLRAAGTTAAVTVLSGNAYNPNETPFLTSVSGTAFYDQRNQPYFAVKYDQWNLIGWGGGRNETGVGTTTPHSAFDAVCAELSSQGFNAITFLAVSSNQGGEVGPYQDGRTWDGVAPWGAGGIGDLNEAYWTRVDDLIDTMASYGMTAFVYVVNQYAVDYAGTAYNNLNTTNGATYGTALGNRYKDRPNIVWQYGADYYGTWDTQFAAVQAAITATGDTHIFTTQFYKETSTSVTWQNTSPGTPPTGWAFQSVYSYNAAAIEVRRAASDEPTKPRMHDNGHYYQGPDDNHIASDLLGWAFTSGSRGMFFGSEGTWQNNTGYLTEMAADPWPNNTLGPVVSALTSMPGWEGLEPSSGSTFVTSSRGTDAVASSNPDYNAFSTQNNYLTAGIRSDGKLAALYTPVVRTGITVDTSKLVSNYKVYWIDPQNGSVTDTTVQASYNTPGNNSGGFGNWYLVFQESTGTAASGTVTVSSTVSGSVTQRAFPTGTTAATATSAGTLTARLQAAGAVTASTTVSGAATKLLSAAGTSALATTVSGTLTAKMMASGTTVTCVTAVSGDATKLQTASGTTGGVTSVTGDATVVTGAVTYQAAGASTAAATTSGAVRGIARPVDAIPLLTTVSGAVNARYQATGTNSAATAVTGNAVRRSPAAGISSLAVTVSGAVMAYGRPTGTNPATTNISGAINVKSQAAGTSASVSAVSGTIRILSKGAGDWVYVGVSAGSRTPKASGTGTTTYSGSAQGFSPVVGGKAGTGTGNYVYAGASTGSRTPRAQGSGTVIYAGTAAGNKNSAGTGTGSLIYSGSASSSSTSQGAGTGATVYLGAATGRRVAIGSGTGDRYNAGTGTGTRTSAGSGTGTENYTGTGVGKRTPKSAGQGTVLRDGSASGLKQSSALALGTYTWIGTATSSGVNAGVGSGSRSYTGSSVGKKTSWSVLTSAYSFTGTASGQAQHRGISLGNIVYLGSATGSKPVVPMASGTGTGAYLYAGSVLGKSPNKATAVSSWVFTGSAAGITAKFGYAAAGYSWVSQADAHRYRNVNVLGVFLRTQDRGFSATAHGRAVSVTVDNGRQYSATSEEQ